MYAYTYAIVRTRIFISIVIHLIIDDVIIIHYKIKSNN